MPEKAYIGLNEDNCWTLYYGDGSEDTKIVLVVGQPFKSGKAIRVVLAEMIAWAEENGYVLDAPLYSKSDISLEDIIDPSEWDENANV